MPVLLVMDSWGKGLQKCFDQTAPGIVTVIIKKGGNIPTLLKIANRYALGEEGNFNTIIIAGGICSVTKLNKNRIAKLRFKTIKKLLEDVVGPLDIGLEILRGDNPKANVIVAPTVGIHLERYNGISPGRKAQRKLNRIITALNKILIGSNGPGSKVPWLSKKIHACKGRRSWSHKYKYLSDGCNFGLQMKDFVVKEIIKCLTKL